MRKQPARQEIIRAYSAVRMQILSLAQDFSSEMQAQPFVGNWTIRELLAHLIGWDFANREACDAVLNCRLPEFYQHIDKDWRTFNAKHVSQYNTGTLEQLIQAAHASQQALVEQLSRISEAEFWLDTGVRYKGYRVLVARLIQSETKDEGQHLTQIERCFQPDQSTQGNSLI